MLAKHINSLLRSVSFFLDVQFLLLTSDVTRIRDFVLLCVARVGREALLKICALIGVPYYNEPRVFVVCFVKRQPLSCFKSYPVHEMVRSYLSWPTHYMATQLLGSEQWRSQGGGGGGARAPHWLVKNAKSHVFGAFEADFL